MSRGKLEKSLAFAIASLGGTLSKMSMDICLYMSQNFNFLSFPDTYTTGSSIMPHKKNPWNFENVKSLWKTFVPRMLIVGMVGGLPS